MVNYYSNTPYFDEFNIRLTLPFHSQYARIFYRSENLELLSEQLIDALPHTHKYAPSQIDSIKKLEENVVPMSAFPIAFKLDNTAFYCFLINENFSEEDIYYALTLYDSRLIKNLGLQDKLSTHCNSFLNNSLDFSQKNYMHSCFLAAQNTLGIIFPQLSTSIHKHFEESTIFNNDNHYAFLHSAHKDSIDEMCTFIEEKNDDVKKIIDQLPQIDTPQSLERNIDTYKLALFNVSDYTKKVMSYAKKAGPMVLGFFTMELYKFISHTFDLQRHFLNKKGKKFLYNCVEAPQSIVNTARSKSKNVKLQNQLLELFSILQTTTKNQKPPDVLFNSLHIST